MRSGAREDATAKSEEEGSRQWAERPTARSSPLPERWPRLRRVRVSWSVGLVGAQGVGRPSGGAELRGDERGNDGAVEWAEGDN